MGTPTLIFESASQLSLSCSFLFLSCIVSHGDHSLLSNNITLRAEFALSYAMILSYDLCSSFFIIIIFCFLLYFASFLFMYLPKKKKKKK